MDNGHNKETCGAHLSEGLSCLSGDGAQRGGRRVLRRERSGVIRMASTEPIAGGHDELVEAPRAALQDCRLAARRVLMYQEPFQ